MKWIKDGFSLDETKISFLMISFAIGFIFSLVMYFLHQDISTNFLYLLLSLIGSITSMNILGVDTVKNLLNKNKDIQEGDSNGSQN